jgi:hypothetical protein
MRNLKQTLMRYKPIMDEVSTAYEGSRYGHRDEDFYAATKSWLRRKQDAWVKGSEVWKAFQEAIDEVSTV